MFDEFQMPDVGRWRKSHLFSLAVHCGAVLAIIAATSVPVIVKPRSVANGKGGRPQPVYLIPLAFADAMRNSDTALLSAPVVKRPKHKTKSKADRSRDAEKEVAKSTPPPGTAYGSVSDGEYSGDEVKPALPLVFAEPQISRSSLPSGLQGDVIVEITIDTQGNVIEERVLQSLRHDIDEKVMAALRGWRFRPATRNGIPILSKHDAHFHFPS
ncbi:MAG TPA: energy transducer TonB [Alphaproteobacteria bacterium]|nr:energy transducer TonB [Alphaproteobacteria bacterium]